MRSQYRVREATPSDDAAVGELLVQAFVSRYAEKMPDVVVTDRRKAELRDVAAKRAVAKVWVAEHEGRVVGTVALWAPGAEGTESWIEGTSCLRHLAVDSLHSGKGVSKVLLDEAERYTRAREWKGVCLHVRRGVVGVAKLYQWRGYQRQPEGDLDLPEVYLEAFFLPA